MNKLNNTVRKAVITALGISAVMVYSGQAAAVIPVVTPGVSDVSTGNAPFRAWADYGTNSNFGWTHTAGFNTFQVGNAADLLAGTRFDVSVNLKQNGGANPMNAPAFSIWTSGTASLVQGAGGHEWSQVRSSLDGGVAATTSDGYLGSAGGGNIIDGHTGWIGYANAGYSFTNGDGDKIQGLLAGASNPNNIGQYGGGINDPLNGTALTNVNLASPYVNGGSATLSTGEAILNLSGLKAGYYLIGFSGSCPDSNANGQGCDAAAGIAQSYQLTVSAVPVPGAVWLFGTALAGFVGLRRRKAVA